MSTSRPRLLAIASTGLWLASALAALGLGPPDQPPQPQPYGDSAVQAGPVAETVLERVVIVMPDGARLVRFLPRISGNSLPPVFMAGSGAQPLTPAAIPAKPDSDPRAPQVGVAPATSGAARSNVPLPKSGVSVHPAEPTRTPSITTRAPQPAVAGWRPDAPTGATPAAATEPTPSQVEAPAPGAVAPGVEVTGGGSNGDSNVGRRTGGSGQAVAGWRPNKSGVGGSSGTIPQPPASILVQDTGNGGEITVTWSDLPADSTGSVVERQPKTGATWGATAPFTVGPTLRTLRDLPGNGAFRYRVAVVNNLGTSAFTDWVTITVISVAPLAPSNLQVTGPLPHLTWTDNSLNESGFDVQRERLSGASWVEPTTFQTATDVAAYSDALAPGTYRYSVRAFNAAGTSAWIGPAVVAVVEMPPTAPSDLVLTGLGNGQQPAISWTDNSLTETRFEIGRETLSGASWVSPVLLLVGSNVTTYTDAPGAGVFRYRVRAANNAGSSVFTAYLTVTTTEVTPAVPGGLQISDLGNGSQTLAVWTDNSNNETGFELAREQQSGAAWINPTTISLARNAVSHTDAPGVGTFRYRLRAVNGAGASAWTGWVVPIVSQVPPVAPSNLAVADLGNGSQVRATWTDNSANEAGFELVRETQSGAAWIGTTTMTIGANVSTWTDAPGVGTFHYRIRATNVAGASPYSAWVTVTVAQIPPTAPSNLAAADQGDAVHARLVWADNANNETSFQLVREAQSGATWIGTTSLTVGANVTTYTDAPGVGTFHYRIRATNSAGSSIYTAWVLVSIVTPPPAAPSGLAVVDLGNGSQSRATWTDNSSNETGFELARQTQSGANWVSPATVTVTANTTAYTDSPGPGTYRYQVRAVNAGGGSAYTAWVTVTVAGTLPPAPTGLQASDAGNRRALLSWTDTSGGAASFQLDRSPAFSGGVVSVPAGVTGFVDQSGAGSFSYRVRSVNSFGASAYTAWVPVTVANTVPAAPSSPAAADLGNQSQSRLSWTDNSDNEASFKIERDTRQTDGTWAGTVLLTAAANAISFTDTPGLGTFRYRVAALNSVGSSAWTTYASVSVSGGWTTFTASADSRLIYVSSSGNDGNSGLAQNAPKRTLAAGCALLRSGFPDWLLLKCGDVWNETMPVWNKSGRSATEPMLVGSYGAGARPLIQTGSSIAMDTQTVPINYIAFVGLNFVANTWTGASAGGPVGLNFVCTGGTWIIEDCRFERYANNLIIQGWPGRVNGVKLRRNIFWNPMRTDSGNTNIYIDNTDNLVVEENLFANLKANDSLTNPVGTKLSHNAYLHESCGPVVVVGNIAYNGRTNLSCRPGGLVRDNISIRGGQGFQIGYQDYRASTVLGNVCTETRDHWNGQPLGQGIVLSMNDGSVVSHNVIANSTDGLDTYTFWIDADAKNLEVKNNVSYNWWQPQYESPLIYFNGTALGPISFHHNDLQQTNSKYCLQFGTIPGLWVTFASNRYYTSRSEVAVDAGTGYTFALWKSLREPTAALQQVAYPQSSRTVGSYNATLGGVNSTEAFLIEAKNNSRSNWRPQYTAHGVNEYIRAGFGVVLPPG